MNQDVFNIGFYSNLQRLRYVNANVIFYLYLLYIPGIWRICKSPLTVPGLKTNFLLQIFQYNTIIYVWQDYKIYLHLHTRLIYNKYGVRQSNLTSHTSHLQAKSQNVLCIWRLVCENSTSISLTLIHKSKYILWECKTSFILPCWL